MYMRAAMGGARAAVSGVAAPAVPVPADAGWYEAETPHGRLRLAVVSRVGAPRHAADAAIALDSCEPLLTALDDWCGTPLNWRWALPPTMPAGPGADARLDWRGGQARLACSWAWLRAQAAPQGDWVGEVQWPAVATTLIAARLRLPADAIGVLEPGGALIVPQSLLPAWHGVLRAVDDGAAETAGAVALLAGLPDASPAAPRLVPGFDAKAALLPYGEPADALYELRLEIAAPVPVDRLAGWRDGPIGSAGPRACLWRCADERGSARRVAAGRLMPWGDGWALAIETLGDAIRPV